ncbi:hypothetical protein ACFV6F_12895 [Kitasatospora phosalacinea]|uniref:hypothetical protein n=1 Tax=Kitasatospora phosalacinea TaxID=2065 RepID=UPI00366100A1
MRTPATSAPACPEPTVRPAGRRLTVTEAVVIVVIVLTAAALALAGLPVAAVTGLLGAATYAARRAVAGLRAQNIPTAGTA